MATVILPKPANNRFEIPNGFSRKEDFQRFVVNHLFPSEWYTVINRTPGYLRNAGNPEMIGLHPAMMLRDHSNGFEFYIECIFKHALIANNLRFLKTNQRADHLERPRFVVLGLGGEAGSPAQIFLVNFKDCPYVSLQKRHLHKKSIPANTAVLPVQLWANEPSTRFSGKEIA